MTDLIYLTILTGYNSKQKYASQTLHLCNLMLNFTSPGFAYGADRITNINDTNLAADIVNIL